jgi:hypothetical protein
MKKTTPPRLHHIANLWTMVDCPSAKKEWSLERKLTEVKKAGFNGICTLLTPAHRRLIEKLDLIAVGAFASAKRSEFSSYIKQNLDGGSIHINVQLGDHDTPIDQATKLAVQVVEEGNRLGAKCAIEVHRDTATETPEKTYAIAEGYRKLTGQLMPMTWDFSHLSIVKHLAPPYWERLLINPKLIQRAEQFHFRPFNGHHCQIPVTDGKGKQSVEIKQWIPFLEKTLELWLQGDQNGREIFVIPEMGPVRGGYNLSTLPNSWEDAKVLRRIIDSAWKKALAARKR